MSDINNNFGDNNQDKEDKLNQSTDPYTQSEGSTYWESNEVQNSFDVQSGPPQENNPNLTQQVHDLTYDEFKKTNYELQQKKKSKKPIIAALIIVILLLGSVATAYGFSATVRNSIDMLIQSPRDYYAQIEIKTLEKSVDKSTAVMNMGKEKENPAVNITANLSYDKETVGALLQGYLGMTISDLEAGIGMPLDSIGFDITSANSDSLMYQNIGLNLNSIDIITGELFIDYAAKEMLIHLPELSSAYLKQSIDFNNLEDQDVDLEKFSDAIKLITPEKTGDFIKRYGKLITNEIEDVELSKKEELTVGDITVESNLLTVYFYPETLKNISSSVLEVAKNDEFIIDLLPLFDMTKEEYQSEIDKAIVDAKNNLDSLPQDKELMVMKVYVGGDGKILGRNIEIIEDNKTTSTLGFFNVEENNKGAYEFYINNSDESDIQIKGSHTKEDGAYTGALTFEVTDETGPTEFTLEYDGLKLVPSKDRMNIYGSISLSSYAMMGMKLVIEHDVKDDAQLADIILKMGKSSLVTLETSTKYLEDFTIPQPDKNAEVYDMLTETDGYALTMDIDGYISSLSDKLGVDLQSLLGYFMPMY